MIAALKSIFDKSKDTMLFINSLINYRMIPLGHADSSVAMLAGETGIVKIELLES